MDRLTVDTTQRGFRDVFFSHGWRVAFSNTDGLGNTKDTVHKMERHMETEEAFVLLQGTVHLVTAERKISLKSSPACNLSRIQFISSGEGVACRRV